MPLHILRYTLYLVSIIAQISFCQLDAGARSIALASSDAGSPSDVFALYSNNASLADLSQNKFGFFYAPSPFGFEELAYGYAAVSIPQKWGALSAGYMFYGFELYKENRFTLGAAYNFKSFLYLGAAINYHSVSIKNYGSASTFYFDLSTAITIQPNLKVGINFYNLNKANISNIENQIPSSISLGLSYQPIKKATLFIAAYKELGFATSFRGGFEFFPIDEIALRVGAGSNPSTFNGGIGLYYSGFGLDYAFSTHPYLGLSNQFSLLFSF